MKILAANYGASDTPLLDILEKLRSLAASSTDEGWDLPASDAARSFLFGDPCEGIPKRLTLLLARKGSDMHSLTLLEGDHASIRIVDGSLIINEYYSRAEKIKKWRENTLFSSIQIVEKLAQLRRHLVLCDDNILEEDRQQILNIKYIFSWYSVLEIGGNTGRSSCIIASVLNDSSNLTVLNSNNLAAHVLHYIREVNGFSFKILGCSCTNNRISQNQCDGSRVKSDKELPIAEGGFVVNDIHEIGRKFDAIVSNCEGSLASIIETYPEILKDVKLIISKNIFSEIADYKVMKKNLEEVGFCLEYSHNGGWGACTECFYQVFTRR